nr:transposase [Maribacter aquimaris]
MARSRYLLYKSPNNWTQNQAERSKILFSQYPDIKVQGLRNIFNTTTSIQTAYTKLAHWYKDVKKQASGPSIPLPIPYPSTIGLSSIIL